MSNDNEWKYWPPVFYTLVWLAGFLIGVIGIMPNATGSMKMIVAAYTAYGIFMANAFIDYLMIIAHTEKRHARPLIGHLNIFIFSATFIAILFSSIFVKSDNVVFFYISSAIMVFAFFGMEFVKHNPKMCYTKIDGTSYQTNLK